ncbi:hypothetical protein EZ216_01525 [Ramlibacter humi]|uniref:TonB C-terminal domain-containing protein n=2 Tax=Ramlibacter humi TaxID=2530451 RepID=A0A4Z0C975_9BURK|nr:hypothetical protein EZ216_01525 [Ramlibacter humi]
MPLRCRPLFTPVRLSLLHVALATAVTAVSAHGQTGVPPVSELTGKTPLAYRAEGSPSKGYYERMKARIDHAILADPPKRAESFMKGSTVVKFTVSESGALESVSTEQATSPEFAQYAVRLVSSLAPFEPFSAEMKKRTDRIEVVTRIEY